MNSKELDQRYNEKKEIFHKYINNIKRIMRVDIFSLINVTLIRNPYTTSFPKFFFSNEYHISNKFTLFIISTIKFYFKNFYFYFLFFISFLFYKIFYKKTTSISKNIVGIDIFFLVDNIIKDNIFKENYFIGLYEVLDKYNKDYIFLPRLYGIGKNPFKLIKLFKIINNDKRNFLFEFDILSISDFFELLIIILIYPFKTLRLLQKNGSKEDILFNNELIKDIGSLGLDPFSRYIFGKNIAKFNKINKIYSWSEFQVIERSFNYGVRTNNDKIILYILIPLYIIIT